MKPRHTGRKPSPVVTCVLSTMLVGSVVVVVESVEASAESDAGVVELSASSCVGIRSAINYYAAISASVGSLRTISLGLGTALVSIPLVLCKISISIKLPR